MQRKADRVSLSVSNGVAQVQLTRAESLNAFDLDMFLTIDRLQTALVHDRSIRAVVVKASGSDFSTGLDVKSLMNNPRSLLRIGFKWHPWGPNLAQRMCTNWQKIPCPVIVAIRGRCWGAGLQFALGGDFRIGAPDSTYAFMESSWGLIPDMGASLRLPGQVPKDLALLWISSGTPITAAQAHQGHLITAVSEDPEAAAQKWANDFVKRSPDALAASKALTGAAFSLPRARLLNRELLSQARLLLGRNRKTALKARREKDDAPAFQNRSRW